MNKTKILLFAIIILSAVLRIYRLDSVPPSISWDEAAVGVNSYYIANFGKDEYGKSFPVYFRSFADDKHPVHIYLTSLSTKILGLSEFSTRFSSALFGILNVLLIFYLAKLLFKKNVIALIASLILAISPYNIHFSRFNHEANFALLFFMLGLIFFLLSVKKNNNFLPLSILGFALSFISYHPSKIVVPLVVMLLAMLYTRQLFKRNLSFFISLLIGAIFFLIIILNPQLLGIARVNQTSLSREAVEKTELFKLTKSDLLGRINLVFTQYISHFSPQYLFISGDKNPRLSSQSPGEFYITDAIFLSLGLIFLIGKRSKEGLILLVWAFFAPLPSALVSEAPHAGRAVFMMGSFHVISAVGLYYGFSFLRKFVVKLVLVALISAVMIFSVTNYLRYYFGEYVSRYAIEWQYGMKQIISFVKTHPEYTQVFMTDVRSQPYIFFLYYLKVPLPEYLNTVIYNNLETKSYNTVSNFDRYYFGLWDPIESFPNKGVLYVVTPSQYDGLRHKLLFDVKKVIYYPNGAAAFYLVSAKL